MEDLEKKIKDAGLNYLAEYIETPNIKQAFIVGAKSPEAKAFHQHKMYSEEEVLNLLSNAIEFGYNTCFNRKGLGDVLINGWIEQHKKK